MIKLSEKIVENLRKIRNERNLTQAALAMFAGLDESQMSRIMKGELNLSIDRLEGIARGLRMSPVDIITYPEIYVRKTSHEEDVEAVLMIKLKESKRKQVLKSVFGREDIEILNE